jgi:hypothetical protein
MYVLAIVAPPSPHRRISGIETCEYNNPQTSDGVCKYFDI